MSSILAGVIPNMAHLRLLLPLLPKPTFVVVIPTTPLKLVKTYHFMEKQEKIIVILLQIQAGKMPR